MVQTITKRRSQLLSGLLTKPYQFVAFSVHEASDVRLKSVVRTRADSADYYGFIGSRPMPPSTRIRGDLPDGQIIWNRVQPLPQKYFASPFARNTFSDSGRPASNRGAYRDRHERWVRDAVDAGCGARRAPPTRTAKSCGPDAPMLASTRR